MRTIFNVLGPAYQSGARDASDRRRRARRSCSSRSASVLRALGVRRGAVIHARTASTRLPATCRRTSIRSTATARGKRGRSIPRRYGIATPLAAIVGRSRSTVARDAFFLDTRRRDARHAPTSSRSTPRLRCTLPASKRDLEDALDARPLDSRVGRGTTTRIERAKEFAIMADTYCRRSTPPRRRSRRGDSARAVRGVRERALASVAERRPFVDALLQARSGAAIVDRDQARVAVGGTDCAQLRSGGDRADLRSGRRRCDQRPDRERSLPRRPHVSAMRCGPRRRGRSCARTFSATRIRSRNRRHTAPTAMLLIVGGIDDDAIARMHARRRAPTSSTCCGSPRRSTSCDRARRARRDVHRRSTIAICARSITDLAVSEHLLPKVPPACLRDQRERHARSRDIVRLRRRRSARGSSSAKR